MNRVEFLAAKSDPTDIPILFWSVPADAFAAVGQWAAAALTIVGFLLVWWQIKVASRIADFESLLDYLEKNEAASEALRKANSVYAMSEQLEVHREAYSEAFLAYCNFSEMQAIAVNKRIVGPVTREMMQEKLVAILMYIRVNPLFVEIIEEARVHNSIYKHLFAFELAHRDDIREFENSLASEEKERLDKLRRREAIGPVTPPKYVQPTAFGWSRHYRVAQYVYNVLRRCLDRIFGMS